MSPSAGALQPEPEPLPPPVTRPLDVPRWLHRGANWSWRLVVVGFALYVLGVAATRLRVVVIPVLIALMVASILSPLVRRLTRVGVPRLLATWVVFLGGILAVVGLLSLAAWGITVELSQGETAWEDVVDDVREWLRTGPLDLSPETIDDLEQRLRDSFTSGAISVSGQARMLIEIFSGTFLALALTFFFVKDGDRMWDWVVGRVHPARRDHVDRAGRAAVGTLSGYLRGVAVTGLVDAVFIALGLWLIGVPLVVPLAVITFFAAFLPVVGATVAGLLAAVVALASNGLGDALLVVGLTIAVQQIEGDVVMPIVMGRSVPLHPAVVLAAIAAGGAVAGVIGAFVGVPLAAVVSAGAAELRRSVPELGADVSAAPPVDDSG